MVVSHIYSTIISVFLPHIQKCVSVHMH